MSLVILDVDGFKAYNDAFGHPVGDEALNGVAEALRAGTREYDVAVRQGGEEFALLPGTDAGDALRVAEQAWRAVASRKWPLRALTVSAGVAVLPHHADAPEALLVAADRALYAARAGRHDRVCTVI